MALTFARPPYSKRDIPPEYDRAWLANELGNIQRAFLPSTVTQLKASVSPYTPTAKDSVLLGDATAGPITIKLPTPARVHGLVLTIKKIDASANAVTIQGTVDGTVNPSFTVRYSGMQIVADESGWWNIGNIP